jgi:RimK family alpha-L-glutamate ligase
MWTMARIGIIGWEQETNVALAEAWRERGLSAALLAPSEAEQVLGPGDVAIGRLDVLPSLDGVEPGLSALRVVARTGARVLNHAGALLEAHDKLFTARRLVAASIPHPHTVFVSAGATEIPLRPPLVLKPRFGSWGVDVIRCETEGELEEAWEEVRSRRWFQRRGVLVQELVPPCGFDLRLIVAGGRVVGAVERIAAPGEWRTNVSLGGGRRPADPPEEAVQLGLAAAEAIGADLIGVDLLPVDGGFVVLELNGAVEFDHNYDLGGEDVYLETAAALDFLPAEVAA